MSESNLLLRDVSIPFEATSFTDSITGDILQTTDYIEVGTTDAGLIIPWDASIPDVTLCPIRCCTPRVGSLTAMTLDLEMDVASALTLKVAIGYFDTDGITAVSSYAAGYVDDMHAQITGGASAIASSGGVLFVDGLNIFPYVPKSGDSTFNQDGFVLLLSFSRSRTTADSIKRFQVLGSADLGQI